MIFQAGHNGNNFVHDFQIFENFTFHDFEWFSNFSVSGVVEDFPN